MLCISDNFIVIASYRYAVHLCMREALVLASDFYVVNKLYLFFSIHYRL